MNEFLEGCKKRVDLLDKAFDKIPRSIDMNNPTLQLDIKFKILQAKTDLYLQMILKLVQNQIKILL